MHRQLVIKFAYKFHFEDHRELNNYTDSVYVGTKAYKELELDRKFDTQNMVPDYFIN
jgi:iron complex outermembrane receptor protein